jgi:hypothetical protein
MKMFLKLEVESYSTEVVFKLEPMNCLDNRNELLLENRINEYLPTKGDKLYFLEGVNVPRIKLKDLALQYGIKTVRDVNDATHVFASKNTQAKICDGNWFYSIKTEDFKAICDDTSIHIDDRYRENIREALENYTEDRLLFNYEEAGVIRHGDNDALNEHADKIITSNMYYSVDSEYVKLSEILSTHNLYDESAILKHINGDDATIIDESMYEQIHQMFESSDKDNHILAMEIMANSNYTESLLYLEMLFKEHSTAMGNCHTRNHVNFKSLVNYLGKNKTYLSTSLDAIVRSLIEKQVITKDMIDVLMRRYADEIQHSGDSTYFKVKTITLNEDLLKSLNVNYTYEHVEDFIPESIIELVDVQNESAQVEEIADEDIEDAFVRIERNELKSELIALEAANPVSESELNKNEEVSETIEVATEVDVVHVLYGVDNYLDNIEVTLPVETVLINQKIEKNESDDFEWF